MPGAEREDRGGEMPGILSGSKSLAWLQGRPLSKKARSWGLGAWASRNWRCVRGTQRNLLRLGAGEVSRSCGQWPLRRGSFFYNELCSGSFV